MIDLGLYQEASFRGIHFHTEKSSRRSSHRVDIKTYPFKSTGLVTDMGLNDAVFNLNIYVLGDDALKRRQDLEEAFDKTGPGPLVHPTRGELTVQVTEARDDEVFTELGVADFNVSFVLAGKQTTPTSSIDTQAAVLDTSLQAEEIVSTSYDFAGLPENNLQTDTEEMTELEEAFQKLSNIFDTRTNQLTTIPGDIPSLRSADNVVGSGLNFSQSAFGVVRSYSNSLSNPLSIVTRLIGHLAPNTNTLWSMLTGSGGSSYQNLIQRPAKDPYSGSFFGVAEQPENRASDNNRLLAQIFYDAATIEAAKNSASVKFDNLVQATQTRNAIGQALAVSINATPTSDPVKQSARRSVLRSLRTAVFRDITERAAQLPNLESYTPAATESARVLAYRLNGSLAEQTPMAERNEVHHPSFMPAGSPLLFIRGNSNG